MGGWKRKVDWRRYPRYIWARAGSAYLKMKRKVPELKADIITIILVSPPGSPFGPPDSII